MGGRYINVQRSLRARSHNPDHVSPLLQLLVCAPSERVCVGVTWMSKTICPWFNGFATLNKSVLVILTPGVRSLRSTSLKIVCSIPCCWSDSLLSLGASTNQIFELKSKCGCDNAMLHECPTNFCPVQRLCAFELKSKCGLWVLHDCTNQFAPRFKGFATYVFCSCCFL